jgi:hypothetical protein
VGVGALASGLQAARRIRLIVKRRRIVEVTGYRLQGTGYRVEIVP